MKRLLLLCFLLLCRTISIAQDPQTPMEMNEYLVSVTDSLHMKGSDWGVELGKAFESGEYGNLVEARKNIQLYVKEKIKIISDLKDVKDSRAFRLAMITFLEFEDSLIQHAFLPFENISEETLKSKIDEMLKALDSLASAEDEALKKIDEEQLIYARNNGFTIETEVEKEIK